MNVPVTVNIADVMPDTIEVDRRSIEVDDTVFDVFGGEHRVTAVRRTKLRTVVVRNGGWVDVLFDGETIRVKRPATKEV